MINLSEQDVRAIVRDEIRKLVGAKSDIQFLPTNEAYIKLGFSSASQLRESVKNGVLRLGHEVQDRRSPGKIYANYYFNVTACIKRLNTAPEKREIS
jgi:hypothetical protein